MFSPFLPCFSRGTQGEWGVLARPRGAFCGGAKKVRFTVLFLGGTANPEGPVAGKQNPDVPPARRRLSHLAVPARKGAIGKESDERKTTADQVGRAGQPRANLYVLVVHFCLRDVGMMNPFTSRPEWEPEPAVIAEIERFHAGGGEARQPQSDCPFLRLVLYPGPAGRGCVIPFFPTRRQQPPCSASCVPSGPCSPESPLEACACFGRQRPR
jgi:hypothetical protein